MDIILEMLAEAVRLESETLIAKRFLTVSKDIDYGGLVLYDRRRRTSRQGRCEVSW